ncbi:sigma factor-binding protein Crl [Vibrio sp. SCSIO 43135]|uniref:Sigma factor-binding protein Crl n=1 Tax=Vibrio paucivorans TaxID=2829489 RepID=A0A9X3CBV9_9VIBR|nr:MULTISPECIES: sigma factor-binding protein Crl [Vibrio]MCW8332856.1 sigma factor-binding protein Crl [Vibrio paucivorans]USD40523.1 sigma factor-binding protein Crl [Vibrio sp. SCSIO 43135]
MSEMTKKPTHYRLISTLRAIGPYLRESQSNEGYYMFDCLSVCVNDKKSPEEREFWGWWLELELSEQGFLAKYHSGKYDSAGDWQGDSIPKKAVAEVNRTQDDFHNKLTATLKERFDIDVELHKESVEFV